MVKKTYFKTIIRCFLHNKTRFLTNLFIVFLSIAFSCGLLAFPASYKNSFSQQYTENNVSDLIVKTKKEEGLDEEKISKLKEDKNVESITTMMAFDCTNDDGDIYRIYIYDYSSTVNKFTLIDGEYPQKEFDLYSDNEILVEKANKNRKEFNVGSRFALDLSSFFTSKNTSSIPFKIKPLVFEVKGVVKTPLYTSVQEEEPWLEENPDDKKVQAILYIDSKLLPKTITYKQNGISINDISTDKFLKTTDIYIRYKMQHDYFSSSYKDQIQEKQNNVEQYFGSENVSVLSLYENTSYATFDNYNDKVTKITLVVPIFFLLLSALVNLITMTRLIDDERKIIGCYVSLGIPKIRIYFKYLSFTFISSLFGIIIGYLFGVKLLPIIIFPAYKTVFDMGSLFVSYNQPTSLIVSLILLLVSLGVTFISSYTRMKEKPSDLMKNKAPKPGKKILLEKIKVIWKPLPFKYKSSIRNIFRQKKNLILTSLSIIGSTILCLLGFGLYDISNSLLNDSIFSNVASSMGSISTVIVIFALLMAVVVIYSLTNMNIQERERELATLKVLGYHDIECSFYTFREMLMITILATLLGLPISYLVMFFVFDYLSFGNVNDVKFTSYILTFVIIVCSTVLVNLLLYPKVKKVDLNDSLKVME